MKTVNLAIQGGGTHGAYAWGVLDRILEDRSIRLDGISATSAGAMNAAMVAYGLMLDGREGARTMLRRFWGHLAELGRFSPVQPTWLDRVTNRWGMTHSPLYQLVEAALRLFSPYDLNPLDFNPLRGVLHSLIDFEHLRRCTQVKLFISATHVRTGKLRIFHTHEITEDVLLASACLPHLFQAVEIRGEHYWDGGYVANPAIYPLMRACDSTEVVIVQVNPLSSDLPRSAVDILDRINEISFNTSVMREMHAIAYLTSLMERGLVSDKAELRPIHVHMIHDEVALAGLDASSKFNTEPPFLEHLFQAGRTSADRWLASHYDDLGKRSTIDIKELYL